MKILFSSQTRLGLAACALLFPTAVQAMPAWVSQIPNGQVNSCSNCHINPAGGGTRTPFGNTVKGYVSPPGGAGSVVWGPALAAIDSDADGRTNGAELLDPTGSWTIGAPSPGNPALVSNPGIAPPHVPVFGPIAAGFLGLALACLGRRSLQRRC